MLHLLILLSWSSFATSFPVSPYRVSSTKYGCPVFGEYYNHHRQPQRQHHHRYGARRCPPKGLQDTIPPHPRIFLAAIPQLNEIGKALSSPALQGREFVIEGHTDNVGTERYNINLSKKRAESVRRYLIKNFHLPADSLRCEGYGEARPIAENTSAEGRSKNRRVEIVAIHQ